jgi:hypothetical protein
LPGLFRGISVELKKLAYFKEVKIAFGTVHWPHLQDFAPETLYLESRELNSMHEPSSTHSVQQ